MPRGALSREITALCDQSSSTDLRQIRPMTPGCSKRYLVKLANQVIVALGQGESKAGTSQPIFRYFLLHPNTRLNTLHFGETNQ